MYTGTLAAVSNRADWIDGGSLINEDNEEVDLTEAALELYVSRDGCQTSAVLTGTIDNGKITLPTSTTFQWRFTPTDMATLCAGTWYVFLRVIIDGIETQIIAATLPVVEGGPS